jgi:hypothetical protein
MIDPMRILSFLFAVSCLIVLGACGEGEEGGESPPPDLGRAAAGPATTSWPSTKSSDRGGFEVSVQPVGGVIELLEHFSLDVTVVPMRDGGAGGMRVMVDADMPAHRHGMNTKPEIIEVGPGHYRVSGLLFHMAGDWVIMVDVSGDGQSERASFPVSVE